MSIAIKVHGGTLESVNKCATCENAQYMIDDTNRPVVYCNSINEFINRKIVSCTAHRVKGASRADYAMRQIAWEISKTPDGGVMVEIPNGDNMIFKDGKMVWRNGKRVRAKKAATKKKAL